jgi:hypothetical protein
MAGIVREPPVRGIDDPCLYDSNSRYALTKSRRRPGWPLSVVGSTHAALLVSVGDSERELYSDSGAERGNLASRGKRLAFWSVIAVGWKGERGSVEWMVMMFNALEKCKFYVWLLVVR